MASLQGSQRRQVFLGNLLQEVKVRVPVGRPAVQHARLLSAQTIRFQALGMPLASFYNTTASCPQKATMQNMGGLCQFPPARHHLPLQPTARNSPGVNRLGWATATLAPLPHQALPGLLVSLTKLGFANSQKVLFDRLTRHPVQFGLGQLHPSWLFVWLLATPCAGGWCEDFGTI